MTTTYNVQYNIPRVQVQLPGRQNRLTGGEFRITPSMTEPVRFQFGNQDGVPLQLIGFNIQFVVWERDMVGNPFTGSGFSNVILNKRMLIDNPYAGEVEMVLTESETLLIGNHASGQPLHWSLFMVNDDGQVFPLQVSNTGGRYGTLNVDYTGSIPIAELIRTPTN